MAVAALKLELLLMMPAETDVLHGLMAVAALKRSAPRAGWLIQNCMWFSTVSWPWPH